MEEGHPAGRLKWRRLGFYGDYRWVARFREWDLEYELATSMRRGRVEWSVVLIDGRDESGRDVRVPIKEGGGLETIGDGKRTAYGAASWDAGQRSGALNYRR